MTLGFYPAWAVGSVLGFMSIESRLGLAAGADSDLGSYGFGSSEGFGCAFWSIKAMSPKPLFGFSGFGSSYSVGFGWAFLSIAAISIKFRFGLAYWTLSAFNLWSSIWISEPAELSSISLFAGALGLLSPICISPDVSYETLVFEIVQEHGTSKTGSCFVTGRISIIGMVLSSSLVRLLGVETCFLVEEGLIYSLSKQLAAVRFGSFLKPCGV